MKKIVDKFFLLIFSFIFILPHCTSRPKAILHPSQLKYKTLEFSPTKPTRITLDNGLIIYLREDHELPLVNIFSLIKTGAYYEPADKVGLAGITGEVMRTGGTKNKSGDEIDEQLEFIAASVETSIGMESGTASLSVLKKDFDQGFSLFIDILMNPVFAAEKVDLSKKKALEAIRRQNDEPSEIAEREFSRLVYGPHPYGRSPIAETINNISREDLIRFHEKYFHPNNMIFGVSGDFNTEEMIGKIKEAFKGWEKKEIVFDPPVSLEKDFSASVNYIYKDINQSVIKLGHLGIQRNNPDYFSLLLMDYILGRGGFESRLMKDIRNERGLAYNVYSLFIPNNLDRGDFTASCETKSASTLEVINLLKGHIKRITEEKVSEEELRMAKDYLINSFVFKFSSTAQIVNQQVTLEFIGLPPDYLERYRDNVTRVSVDDVLNAAKKYLQPDKLIVLAVGNKAGFEKPLESIGPVHEIILK